MYGGVTPHQRNGSRGKPIQPPGSSLHTMQGTTSPQPQGRHSEPPRQFGLTSALPLETTSFSGGARGARGSSHNRGPTRVPKRKATQPTDSLGRLRDVRGDRPVGAAPLAGRTTSHHFDKTTPAPATRRARDRVVSHEDARASLDVRNGLTGRLSRAPDNNFDRAINAHVAPRAAPKPQPDGRAAQTGRAAARAKVDGWEQQKVVPVDQQQASSSHRSRLARVDGERRRRGEVTSGVVSLLTGGNYPVADPLLARPARPRRTGERPDYSEDAASRRRDITSHEPGPQRHRNNGGIHNNNEVAASKDRKSRTRERPRSGADDDDDAYRPLRRSRRAAGTAEKPLVIDDSDSDDDDNGDNGDKAQAKPPGGANSKESRLTNPGAAFEQSTLAQSLRRSSRRATRSSSSRNNALTSNNLDDPRVVLEYPLGSMAIDAVAVTAGDLARLNPGEFLNDNVVDFYLKLLTTDDARSVLLRRLEIASRDLTRTIKVFSSHFFAKLCERRVTASSVNSRRAAHKRVERWTNDGDVFEKDYVVVPIVDKLHWSLGVVCHAGLLTARQQQQQRAETTKESPAAVRPREPDERKQADKDDDDDDKAVVDVDAAATETTDRSRCSRERKRTKKTLDNHDAESSSRSKQTVVDLASEEEEEEQNAEDDPDALQPCVLFLDSLGGIHKAGQVHGALRSWLSQEYLQKRAKARRRKAADATAAPDDDDAAETEAAEADAVVARRFHDKASFPCVKLKLPQQDNGWDCGVYVLRYAFQLLAELHSGELKCTRRNVARDFKDKDFHAWFKQRDIDAMRKDIRDLVDQLCRERDALAGAAASCSHLARDSSEGSRPHAPSASRPREGVASDETATDAAVKTTEDLEESSPGSSAAAPQEADEVLPAGIDKADVPPPALAPQDEDAMDESAD